MKLMAMLAARECIPELIVDDDEFRIDIEEVGGRVLVLVEPNINEPKSTSKLYELKTIFPLLADHRHSSLTCMC